LGGKGSEGKEEKGRERRKKGRGKRKQEWNTGHTNPSLLPALLTIAATRLYSQMVSDMYYED